MNGNQMPMKPNSGKIIPFFMAYPLEAYFDGKAVMEKDKEYLTELYPIAAKKIREKIKEELKCRDYKASPIYDEYPDRLSLSLIVNAVYERTGKMETGDQLRDLVEVLLYQELLARRQAKNEMFYL
ncbi:MAG: hypothetical protein QM697_12035 [Lachnospiraceae bacterium]